MREAREACAVGTGTAFVTMTSPIGARVDQGTATSQTWGGSARPVQGAVMTLRMFRRQATVRLSLAAVGVLVAACTPASQPSDPLALVATAAPTAQPTHDASGLAPLVTDPPESVRAAQPSETTYSVYQGIVCGIAPRPEYGYTVRYPKIWEAREQGATTWLVDLGNDGLVHEEIGTGETIAPGDDPSTPRIVGAVDAGTSPVPTTTSLEQLLVDGWQARGLSHLQLEAVPGALVGGQPGARWNLRYTAPDGMRMAGYTSATVANGRLYRVEMALPADRYERRLKASAIVADQLLITMPTS